MTELVDQATMLRNAALAKIAKASNRVTGEMVLGRVITFLNNENLQFLAVEDTFPNGTKHTAIVGRFKTVIIENKLDGLVYPVINGDHVFLTKLVAPEVKDDES
jgi:hypothetical protein